MYVYVCMNICILQHYNMKHYNTTNNGMLSIMTYIIDGQVGQPLRVVSSSCCISSMSSTIRINIISSSSSSSSRSSSSDRSSSSSSSSRSSSSSSSSRSSSSSSRVHGRPMLGSSSQATFKEIRHRL